MPLKKRNILVIDDEEKIRKILSIHLNKENYHVITSCGGNGVFKELQQNNYEMVICDIRMPEVDGTQILKYIKEKFDDIPVVILTGFHDINTAINVLKMGAVDFLIKPIPKDQLIKVVRNAFRIRDLTIRNKQLELDNLDYQKSLEERVENRTAQLNEKTNELKKAYRTLQSMNLQMVKVLAEAIEAKDKYTRGHCERMRLICLKIGEFCNISNAEKVDLEFAAILHDLGKIGIADTILNKPDGLDEDEFDIIKEHPLIGEKILAEISTLQNVSKAIKHHHENFDGTGYPDGLKSENIPFLSRIIAVADVFDALTSNRPYRKAFSVEHAIAEMENMAGEKLDKTIVELFKSEKSIFNHHNGKKLNTEKKVVLIVDDEYLVRKTLTYHLQKEGFEILEADTGRSAIDLAISHKIDVVVCDLKLPDIDGTKLIKMIKEKNKFLHIIVSSGCLNREIINSVMQNGASDCLEKPYLKEKLLSIIRKLLVQEVEPVNISQNSLQFKTC